MTGDLPSMHLLLVRHAESMGNATGDYSVATHDSLSPRGREQAQELAAHLRTQAIDAVLVSPLSRARQTILPYLEATGRTAEVWPELAEGCWQEPSADVADAWPRAPMSLPPGQRRFLAFRAGEAVRPAGTETFAQGLFRVRAALALLMSRFAAPPVTVLVLTHGHFLREFLRLALGAAGVRFPHDNCGMTSLTFAGAWMVRYVNRLA